MRKFSITNKPGLRISPGKYTDKLPDVAYSRDPIPAWLDAILVRMAAACRSGSRDDVWFYQTPRPTRIGGLNCFLFSVAQFQIFVKVDPRAVSGGNLSPWIKGKEKIDVPIFPMHTIPDGRKFLDMERANPRLEQFLSRTRARAEELTLANGTR